MISHYGARPEADLKLLAADAGLAWTARTDCPRRMILNAIQSGEGPPVVLLHGLFGAARNFGAVQRALSPGSG